MKYKLNRIGLLQSIALMILFQATASAQDYDVVILNGRVMDPETKFDKVCNVGIKDGRIAIISEIAGEGLLPPRHASRRDDRRECRDGSISIRIAQRGDQCAMPAHRMPEHPTPRAVQP